jgi:hypothetical protein
VLPLLKTKHIHALFDPEQHLIRVKYYGELTADVPAQFYAWLEKLVNVVDVKTIYGGLFDFRQVTKFHTQNLSTTRKNSRNINQKVDMGHLPIAFITETLYQTEMARILIQLVPQPERRRIVKSEEDGLQFIHNWNQHQA